MADQTDTGSDGQDKPRRAGLTITDRIMRSPATRHTAEPSGDGWAVSWLPGRTLTRSQAVTSMMLAQAVGRGVGDPSWPRLDGWAADLGLSGPDVTGRVSEADPEAGK
jgi:hypothetical protein